MKIACFLFYFLLCVSQSFPNRFQVKSPLRSATACAPTEDEFVASNCFDTHCISSMHMQKSETRTYELQLWNSTMFLFHMWMGKKPIESVQIYFLFLFLSPSHHCRFREMTLNRSECNRACLDPCPWTRLLLLLAGQLESASATSACLLAFIARHPDPAVRLFNAHFHVPRCLKAHFFIFKTYHQDREANC